MDYANMTDNELMAAFYACDEAAFDEIVRRWTPRLHGYFRGLGWSAADAEDLTQETLVRIFSTKASGRGRFDPTRAFPSWIYRIGHNCSEDRRRRDAHQPRPTATPPDQPPAAPRTADSQRDADLEGCLQTLDEREREFMELWKGAYGDLNETEIAEVLEVSNATVSRIKESALDKLRKCMEGKGYHG
jgi:RNA polymerase sigma-70 factor (ECF subfamily)